MSDQTIENIIITNLGGDTQRKLLKFVAFLEANDMYFERGRGYWSNQLYYMIKYKNEYVCFILINGIGDEKELSPLTIWTDDKHSSVNYRSQRQKGRLWMTEICCNMRKIM